MTLSDRLKGNGRAATDAPPPGEHARSYQDIKLGLHRAVVDRLDFKSLESLPPEQMREELHQILAGMVVETEMPLNRIDRERLIAEVIDEVTGLGPLEILLADPTISDILVNTCSTIYVERAGRLERSAVRFRDDNHLLHIINRIVSRVGRRIDELCPMVDARLPDGSRINAVIPPIAVDGPLLSIRRFGALPLRFTDLLANDTLTPAMHAFLSSCVRARLNVLISGGTGSGKTTLLNVLSSLIPHSERIVTIEDAAELQLQQPHVCRLETRPRNIEGKGQVVQRDLVRNSLRMRPDRIIVGEVRGAEVFDMLQAMNTGHEGSMTTIHANSPRDALHRLMAMMNMAELNLSEAVTAQVLSRAIDLIVHTQRLSDGRRRVTHIAEITGTEGTVIAAHEIFAFEQTGVSEKGEVLGGFEVRGSPRCLERLSRAGAPVDPELFRRREGER